MALPTAIETDGGREPFSLYGVGVVVFPGDPAYTGVVRRATDLSATTDVETFTLGPRRARWPSTPVPL